MLGNRIRVSVGLELALELGFGIRLRLGLGIGLQLGKGLELACITLHSITQLAVCTVHASRVCTASCVMLPIGSVHMASHIYI